MMLYVRILLYNPEIMQSHSRRVSMSLASHMFPPQTYSPYPVATYVSVESSVYVCNVNLHSQCMYAYVGWVDIFCMTKHDTSGRPTFVIQPDES